MKKDNRKVDYERARRDRKRLIAIHKKAKEIINITSQIKDNEKYK